MSESSERESVEGVPSSEPVEREAPPAEEGVEREAPRSEEPLKRHGDALLDGTGSRQGEDAGRPEELSQ